MADCYDVDVDHSEEPGASTSSLPFAVATYGKSPGPTNPVAMFYPQLTYDLHPLLLNQRRRAGQDKEDSADGENPVFGLVANPIHKELLRQSLKQKSRTPKRKSVSNDQGDASTASGDSFPEITVGDEPIATDFSAKARKSFFCRACGKAFKFQTSLLRHNNKVHISKYQCPTCSRVFSRQAYLDVHTSKQGSSCYLGPGFANTSIAHSPKSDYGSNLSLVKSEKDSSD